jgi:hypothetical protein
MPHPIKIAGMLVLLASCTRACPSPSPADAATPSDAGSYSHVRVTNRTASPTTVYASFGADSKVTSFPFCGDSGGCSFNLAPNASQDLPTGGVYLNVTLAFDQAPGCNVTLGEINVSNPGWNEDTANISLVNGWSNNVEIDVGGSDAGIVLGPTKGPNGNESVFGVYPNGCDICVAKQSPPCGIAPCGSPDGSPARCGCKSGSQYAPTVPCQASFARGQDVVLALVSH